MLRHIRRMTMPVRFRKSIKLAPGIRMNLSGSGVGWTLGPRGSSIGISKRGTRLNSSFMGFSSSQKNSLAPKKVVQTCNRFQVPNADLPDVRSGRRGKFVFS
ncbi:DUF4236 domain-containing protein [Pseudomonas lini]